MSERHWSVGVWTVEVMGGNKAVGDDSVAVPVPRTMTSSPPSRQQNFWKSSTFSRSRALEVDLIDDLIHGLQRLKENDGYVTLDDGRFWFLSPYVLAVPYSVIRK